MKITKKNVLIGVGIVLGICFWVGIIVGAAYTTEKDNNYSKTIEIQSEEIKGDVKVFEVSITKGNEPTAYIEFLENFDESKYEIIDIM